MTGHQKNRDIPEDHTHKLKYLALMKHSMAVWCCFLDFVLLIFYKNCLHFVAFAYFLWRREFGQVHLGESFHPG